MSSALLQKQLSTSLSKGEKRILLIRHAERHPFEKGSLGLEVGLTSQGKKSAEQLGHSLKDITVNKILTSPVERCIHTSECFVKGYGKSCAIEPSSLIGSPGPFIFDPDAAGPVFLSTHLIEVAQSIVKGVSLPGMRTLSEGGQIFLDHVSTLDSKITLMISHDIIIALLSAFLLQDVHVENYMPDFLKGLLIEYTGNKISRLTQLT
ncbi:histidine phosphatase family protein [Candidatus Neptunochlamydia vexilliferae]|uniref:histidine phosphatase family protein n=1 Tax=Candidatus Neptunichlamydia vexilliferae TaxID=1651774 RepID=UPI00189165DD|nr:histidine phosphatase family protein [Candidatus Neptunochlamydia vexilliferae]